MKATNATESSVAAASKRRKRNTETSTTESITEIQNDYIASTNSKLTVTASNFHTDRSKTKISNTSIDSKMSRAMTPMQSLNSTCSRMVVTGLVKDFEQTKVHNTIGCGTTSGAMLDKASKTSIVGSTPSETFSKRNRTIQTSREQKKFKQRRTRSIEKERYPIVRPFHHAKVFMILDGDMETIGSISSTGSVSLSAESVEESSTSTLKEVDNIKSENHIGKHNSKTSNDDNDNKWNNHTKSSDFAHTSGAYNNDDHNDDDDDDDHDDEIPVKKIDTIKQDEFGDDEDDNDDGISLRNEQHSLGRNKFAKKDGNKKTEKLDEPITSVAHTLNLLKSYIEKDVAECTKNTLRLYRSDYLVEDELEFIMKRNINEAHDETRHQMILKSMGSCNAENDYANNDTVFDDTALFNECLNDIIEQNASQEYYRMMTSTIHKDYRKEHSNSTSTTHRRGHGISCLDKRTLNWLKRSIGLFGYNSASNYNSITSKPIARTVQNQIYGGMDIDENNVFDDEEILKIDSNEDDGNSVVDETSTSVPKEDQQQHQTIVKKKIATTSKTTRRYTRMMARDHMNLKKRRLGLDVLWKAISELESNNEIDDDDDGEEDEILSQHKKKRKTTSHILIRNDVSTVTIRKENLKKMKDSFIHNPSSRTLLDRMLPFYKNDESSSTVTATMQKSKQLIRNNDKTKKKCPRIALRELDWFWNEQLKSQEQQQSSVAVAVGAAVDSNSSNNNPNSRNSGNTTKLPHAMLYEKTTVEETEANYRKRTAIVLPRTLRDAGIVHRLPYWNDSFLFARDWNHSNGRRMEQSLFKTKPQEKQPECYSDNVKFHPELVHALKGRARLFARYEFFYSDLDRGWYKEDEFAKEIATQFGIVPEITTMLSLQEWYTLRRRIVLKKFRNGKVPRFSKQFIQTQINHRDQYRNKIRLLQKHNYLMVQQHHHQHQQAFRSYGRGGGGGVEFSNDNRFYHCNHSRANSSGTCTTPFEPATHVIPIGTVVHAYCNKYRVVQRGTVIQNNYQTSMYLVRFHNEQFGTEYCPDTEVAIASPISRVSLQPTTATTINHMNAVVDPEPTTATVGTPYDYNFPNIPHNNNHHNSSMLLPIDESIQQQQQMRKFHHCNSGLSLSYQIAEYDAFITLLIVIERAKERKKHLLSILDDTNALLARNLPLGNSVDDERMTSAHDNDDDDNLAQYQQQRQPVRIHLSKQARDHLEWVIANLNKVNSILETAMKHLRTLYGDIYILQQKQEQLQPPPTPPPEVENLEKRKLPQVLQPHTHTIKT